MTRYRRQAAGNSLFRGAEVPRLLAMVIMFGVIVAMIGKARQPDMWKQFVGPKHSPDVVRVGDADPYLEEELARAERRRNPSPAVKPSDAVDPDAAEQPTGNMLALAKPAAETSDEKVEESEAAHQDTPEQTDKQPAATATGPEDRPNKPAEPETFTEPGAKVEHAKDIPHQDSFEWDEFTAEVQGIEDSSIVTKPSEMRAYNRLHQWARRMESFASMEAEARPALTYAEYTHSPDKHRGRLYRLQLTLHRGTRHPVTVNQEIGDKYVYEFQGTTKESRGRLYDILVVDPPAGFPIAAEMKESIEFVGYFFKVQGYQPGRAKPGAAPETMPVFVGRINWNQKAPAEAVNTDYALYMVIGVVIVIAAVIRLAIMLRPSRNRVTLAPLGPDEDDGRPKIDLDTWLTQAEEGAADSGNNPDEYSELNNGSPARNGAFTSDNRPPSAPLDDLRRPGENAPLSNRLDWTKEGGG